VAAAVLALLFLAFAPAEPEPTPWRHTLFLQFDGASLTWVPSPDDENAALGHSFLAKFEGSELPVYDGDDADRAAVLQAVTAHLEPFGVSVVAERPPARVPYTMAVVGGQWDDTAATSVVRGIAPEVDCERLNQRHVVFAFVSADETVVAQATTVSQEAGHAWGLDHVVGEGLIMSYDLSAAATEFSDGCVPLCEEACQGPDSIYCARQHLEHCAAGSQDSRAELLSTFGDADPDDVAPTVEILSPTDGITLAPGSDLLVEVAVTDNYGGVGWDFELLQDGESVATQTAFDRELVWPLGGLPEGSYEVRVRAQDHAGHQTTVSALVSVADVDDDGTLDGATTGSQGSSDSASSGDDELQTGGAAADDSETDGCACGTTGAPPPLWMMLPMLGFSIRRLTRARTSR